MVSIRAVLRASSALAAAAVLGCATPAPPEVSPVLTPLRRIEAIPTELRAEMISASLPLRRKVAERFVGWIPGTVADESTAELARSGIGGFIVYPRNMTEREQTITLTSSLQREALKGGNPLGLLFCADQEGGRVTALRMPGFIRLPSARSLALYADEEAVRAAAYLSGIELRSLGITMNLAPVLDLDAGDAGVIGDRSLGADPGLVARLGEAFIRGTREAGIASTAKHFPGHGVTTIDSHGGLPRVPMDYEELLSRDLVPFVRAVEAGVDAVMTAHVVYEGVDRSYPATLSERFIEDILRERLGYGGLVMTDGLSMGALRDHFGLQETLTLCLRNGIDLILVHDRYDASALIDTALSIYESGAVPAWSLEESLMRIIRLKIRLGLTADAGYSWESAR